MLRWLLIVVSVLVIGGSRADAQVFKPRGKAGAAKTAKKPAAAPAPAATKKARVAKSTPAKKKSRAADAGRPTDLTPAAKKPTKKGRASKLDEDEGEVASAPDDDDVIITDDED